MKGCKNIEVKIRYERLADFDFFQIYNYIYYVLQNPIAAKNTADGIQNKILDLKKFYETKEIYIQTNLNFKFFSYKNYLIFYDFKEKEKTLIIKRILYKKRNYKEFL